MAKGSDKPGIIDGDDSSNGNDSKLGQARGTVTKRPSRDGLYQGHQGSENMVSDKALMEDTSSYGAFRGNKAGGAGGVKQVNASYETNDGKADYFKSPIDKEPANGLQNLYKNIPRGGSRKRSK